jgi:hypothetical protein
MLIFPPQNDGLLLPFAPCWALVMLPLCMRKRHQCLKSQEVHFITIIFRGNCLPGWSTKWVSKDTSACKPTQEPTAHNPQPTTHNPQPKTSRWAAATLPSSSFALSLHGWGSGAPKSWCRDYPWVHSKRPVAGLQSPWPVLLLGAPKRDPSNIRERDGVSALGGRHLEVKRNNQSNVGVSSEGIIIEETQSQRNVWGGRRIIVWGWQIVRQKIKKMKYTVAFGQPMIDNGSHNNQPKTGICYGGEYGEDVRRLGGAGGSAIPLFWGR